jgi:hypothetical protein
LSDFGGQELQVSEGANYVPAPKVVALRTRRGPELASLEDIRREMSKVYRQCRAGKIRPEDGSRYTFMLVQIARVIEIGQVEARVKALERALRAREP